MRSRSGVFLSSPGVHADLKNFIFASAAQTHFNENVGNNEAFTLGDSFYLAQAFTPGKTGI